MCDVYQMVTDKIIADMENGVIPWEKPWVNTSGTKCAISHATGKAYSLLNQIYIGMEGEYVTFDQARKENGSIKKGAKARKIIHFNYMEKEHKDRSGNVVLNKDGTPKKDVFPVLRYYNVFHIDDTEGVKHRYAISKGPVADNHPIEDAQKAIHDYIVRSGVTVRHYEQDRSYYSPGNDEIILPHMNQFSSAEDYYATVFHELAHSTGIRKRLNRDMGTSFGSEKYSKEELVAEIASAVLCNRFGLDTSKIQRNVSAYCQNWIGILKNNKSMVVWAATRAEKAVKLILNEEAAEDSAKEAA